jgi:hypothetical protein
MPRRRAPRPAIEPDQTAPVSERTLTLRIALPLPSVSRTMKSGQLGWLAEVAVDTTR